MMNKQGNSVQRPAQNTSQVDVVERLLQAVPEFRATYEQQVDEHYARGLPHVIFGSLLVDFIKDLQEKISHRPDPQQVNQLLRAFALIEELASKRRL